MKRKTMVSGTKLPVISIEEIFPGKTENEIIEESNSLRRKRLKAWYIPYEKSVKTAEENNVKIGEDSCEGSKRYELFYNRLKSAKKSIVLGSGSVNSDVYCEKRILSLIERRLKDKLNVTLFFGGLLMTKDKKNQFFDDILLPYTETKHVEILYFPYPYRLAFHSYIKDSSEVVFQGFHYEFRSNRDNYSLDCKPHANFLIDYYFRLAKKFKAVQITTKNADIVKRQERDLFFNLEKILASSSKDKLI